MLCIQSPLRVVLDDVAKDRPRNEQQGERGRDADECRGRELVARQREHPQHVDNHRRHADEAHHRAQQLVTRLEEPVFQLLKHLYTVGSCSSVSAIAVSFSS